MKRLLAWSVLMLGLLQNLKAQSAMQLQTERKDSAADVPELTIEEVMQIAEEEKALEAEKLSQEKALAKAKKAGKVRDLGTQYPGDAN